MYPYRKYSRSSYNTYRPYQGYQGGSSYPRTQNKRRRTAYGYTPGVQDYTQSSSSSTGGFRRRYRTYVRPGGSRGVFGRRRLVGKRKLTTIVRNTMQKMEGLHTAQFVEYPVAIAVTSNLTAASVTLTCGSANDFVNNWAILTAGDSTKVTIRTIATKGWFTNNSNTPVIMQYWLLKPTKISTGAISSAMADQLTTYNQHFIDPTQSNSFRRYFSILDRGTRMIKAGQAECLQYSQFFPAGVQISGDVEGNSQWTPTLGFAYYCKFMTIPVEESGTGFLTSLGEVSINCAFWKQTTYYNLQDAVPTAKSNVNIPIGSAKIFTDKTEQAVDNAD